MDRRHKRHKLNRWHLVEIATGLWFAEDGEHSRQVQHCHCLACAYTKVVSDYGGDVDLRGLHRYGPCYEFLAVLVRQERDKARAEARNIASKLERNAILMQFRRNKGESPDVHYPGSP